MGEDGIHPKFLNLFLDKFVLHSSAHCNSTYNLWFSHRSFQYVMIFCSISTMALNSYTGFNCCNSCFIIVAAQRLVRLTLEHPQYPTEYSFPSYEEDWIVTKLRKKAKAAASDVLFAVDCEMVLCEDGTEALVKICVVDQDLEVKLHEFVKPNKAVADYRTQITGVSAEDLDGVTCSLADIQTVLGFELRKKGAPHNCVDDACAAMKLVLAKTKNGFDDVIPAAQESQDNVADSEKAKLLVHRIPKDLPNEELGQIIPGECTIEVQVNKKARGDKYSAVAIFKSPEDALDAFETLQGIEEKDSSGRSQKPVSIQLKSGTSAIIYVRKMSPDNPVKVSAKRPSSTELAIDDLKKQKIDQVSVDSQQNSCVDHVKEIERLKDLISQRDQEISSLHKIVAALTRKQGL
ncbi:putative small RNA degrading nuclease 4 [Bienertia sinuspersici]